MEIKFTGDFAKLERFAGRVNKVPDSLITVNEQLAEETIELIREGIAKSRNPYGKKFLPLVLRVGGTPLRDSGGMANSWNLREATRERFVVANGKSYAIFHQRGTGIYGPRKKRIVPVNARALRLPGGIYRSSVAGTPKRLQVPLPGRLPKVWRERYVDTATEVLEELFK